MTTEVLRNMLYANSSTLTNLGSVVMDEVHYLADKFRGAVWEEVLIHLMESVQVISLSATVSNAEEFGEWLGEVRGSTEVIVSEIRPIPLYQHVLIGNRLIDLFVEPGRVNPEILGLEREALRRVKTPRGRRDRYGDTENRLTRADIIDKLQRENLLPAITFIFSRAGCDAAVKQCLQAGIKLTSAEERLEIITTAQRYTQNLAEEDLEVLGYREGNAVVQWSPTVDSATAAGLASTRTYPLRSSFTPSYNMSINLIARFGRERARGSLESSFAQFQADRAVVGLVRQIRKNESLAAELTDSAQCHLGDFNEYSRIRIEIKELEKLLSKRDGRRTFDQRQRLHMENELDGMRRGLRQHACHPCSDRETHARIAERADRLNRESDGLRARVENRTHVIAKTFDRICNVLTHLGYIEGEKPLEQGKILAKIYAESDLLLTESIRRGVLRDLNAPELLSVASAMIYESRSAENYAPKMPNQNVANSLAAVAKIWVELEDIENEFDVKTQREPDFGFCYPAYRWANGHSLSNVLKGTDMTVGDFVRSIRQLIDLLTQIGGASEELRSVCREGIRRLDRGVISDMLADV